MRHVALYFGSFNPIHNGHITLASTVLNQTAVDEVCFVISPQSPFKKQQVMMDPIDRWTIVRKSIMLLSGMSVSNVEFDLPKPNYTVTTLRKLRDLQTDTKFSIVVGGDIFKDLSQWRDIDDIINHHEFYVAQRNGQDLSGEGRFWLESKGGKYTVVNMPPMNISSTDIRGLLDEGRDIQDYVPHDTANQIQNAYNKYRHETYKN